MASVFTTTTTTSTIVRVARNFPQLISDGGRQGARRRLIRTSRKLIGKTPPTVARRIKQAFVSGRAAIGDKAKPRARS